MCVCLSVCLSGHAILAVSVIKSIMKDSIMLSIRCAAILQWRVFFNITLRTLTLKDHLESNKYAAKKEVRKAKNSSSNAPSTSQQMALGMAVKSRDIPCEQSLSSTA